MRRNDRANPVSGKSLFHIHADRIAAARARYRNDVPWYIMTSDATHEPTRAFFERHAFFGVPPEEVHFFRQGMLPALDREFRLAPVAKDRILLSPDGHGGVFAALLDTGMLEDMERRGIEEISYFQVDNPLVPAVDPVFIGFHHRKGAEMSNKAMWKREPEEPLGAFVKIGDTLAVREYSDLSKEQQQARNDSGELIYGLGSPAIHMIRTEFARRMAEREDSLPFHLAEKRSPVLNAQGEVIEPEEKNVYKFEKFIFDALAHAERSVILEIDRAKEFSPVKNGSGSDSPETARADMTRLYAEWLEEAGVSVPRDERGEPRYAIEISPRAAPDREALLHDVRPSLDVDGPLYLGEEPA